MIVVLAEKPSVARDLAGHLHAQARHDGYFEGNGYQVTWALGHLVGLQEPGDYESRWRKWAFETLPILPDRFELKPRGDSGAGKQLAIVKRLFRNAAEIICATDAGREGELIFRYIQAIAGCESKPARRLWLKSLTPQAIRRALDSMRPLSDYDALYAAAKCRSEADWMIGMNATRFYTLSHGNQGLLFSIGRVQTPLLAMIVQRDDLIRTFQPQPFWELLTQYRQTTFRHERTVRDKGKKETTSRFDKQTDAEALLRQVQGHELHITDIRRKPQQLQPPQLFDLTELQREANRRFGLSAARTLQIAQTLYERKLISYPRTDSRYLSSDMKHEVPKVLEQLREQKPEEIAPLDLSRLRFTRRIVDDRKVSDHHAIIPTGTSPSGLDATQRKVYDAIVVRLIAAFYPPCEKEVTNVTAVANQVPFSARGVRVVKPGWTELYPRQQSAGRRAGSGETESEAEDAQAIPSFTVGEHGPHQPRVKRGETTPPQHFTENTLLGAMETAGKLVDDLELREAMREKGLGTPATRAAMIETLLQRSYVQRQGKQLTATDLGRYLVARLRTPSLRSPELTGEWEAKLNQIERDESQADDFTQQIRAFAREVTSRDAAEVDASRWGECPQCGQAVIKGKRGYGCSAWRDGMQIHPLADA